MRDPRIGEVVLTREHRGRPLVPLGLPGAFKTYRFSNTRDLEDDLARVAPFIATFQADARSQPGRPTAHRLIALVEATEEDVGAHQRGEPGRHLMEVVELGQVVALLNEWRTDPAGAEIVADLKDPGLYAHSILLLAAARTLRHWGNDVRLVHKQPTRAPDVRVVAPSGDVAVELKAPREFDGGDWVRTKSADQVAAKVLRKSRSQRHTAQASVVVVAGYRIPDQIREVFSRELASQISKSPSIAAACVVSLGAALDDQEDAAAAAQQRSPFPRPFTSEETAAILSLQITTTVLRNASYRGPVPIVDMEGSEPGLRLPARRLIVRASPPVPPPL